MRDSNEETPKVFRVTITVYTVGRSSPQLSYRTSSPASIGTHVLGRGARGILTMISSPKNPIHRSVIVSCELRASDQIP
jgi:hypothetical protein